MDKYHRIFLSAQEAGKSRNYGKAVKLLTEIVCNTDKIPAAYLYLGRSYHALGEYNKAIPLLEHYVKVKSHPPGFFFLGRAYLAYGMYRQAVLAFRRVIEGDRNFSPAYSLTGLAYLKARRPEIALEYQEAAVALEPENEQYFTLYLNTLLVKALKSFQSGNMEEARQMFEFTVKHRQDSVIPYVYLGRIYKEKGEIEQALEHYEKAAALAPEDRGLLMQKGFLLLLLGRHEEGQQILRHFEFAGAMTMEGMMTPLAQKKLAALTHFGQKKYKEAVYFGTRYLKEAPGDPDVHAIVGEAFMIMDEWIKAGNHFSRSLENRYSREVHYALLQVLWELGELEDLLSEAEKIIAHDPGDHYGKYFRALAIVDMELPPEEIIRAIQEQIKTFGPDPRLMRTMGKVYKRYDFPELAENWFKKTLKLIPDDEFSLRALVDLYVILDKKRPLGKAYEDYLALKPGDREIKKDYLKYLTRNNKHKKAIVLLNDLIPQEKNDRTLRKTLATCYVKSGQYEEAIIRLKTLITEEPGNLDYLQQLVYCLDQSGRRKFAIHVLEKAARFFRGDYKVLSVLGVFLYKENELEKALAIFRDLQGSYPRNWKVYHNMGVIYEKMGNTIFANKFKKRANQYKNPKKGE